VSELSPTRAHTIVSTNQDNYWRVQRRLSQTPLTREHEDALRRKLHGGLKAATIAWDEFRRDQYPDAALALLADNMLKLAEGEYAAVSLFGQIVSGLAMTGAPIDIVAAATTVSADELRHSEYCLRMAQLASGKPHELRVDHRTLSELASTLGDRDELDFHMLKYAAVGETLAAALLHACKRQAKDPVVKSLFRSLCADEVRHARLGWYYMVWREKELSVPQKQRLADRIAAFVVNFDSEFHTGRDAPAEHAESARALGVLDTPALRTVVIDVVEEEILPGLDALGFGTSSAWQSRPPSTSLLS